MDQMVQRELAAVIALKARKSAIHQNEENSSQEIRGLEELKTASDAQQADDGGGRERPREEAGPALVLRKVWSRSPAPERRGRYVVVSGTPEKILEHLLSDLHLEAAQDKETETLLDDFLLTYTVFMTTDDLCQAFLRHYCAKNH